MIGTRLHSRRRRITSSPSMSGRPRSMMTTSGWRVAASIRPSSPVVASWRRYPWLPRVARRKRRICGSSSMRTISGGPEVLPPAFGSRSGAIAHGGRALLHRERKAHGHAAARAVLGPDAAAVRAHDPARDREPEARSPHRRSPLGAVELLEDQLLLAGPKPRPSVGDFDDDRPSGVLGGDLDRTVRRRVLDHVVDEVHEDLLDEDVVHGNQRKLRRNARR